MMESFWGTMQLELLGSKPWQTRDELDSAVFEWMLLVQPMDAEGGRGRMGLTAIRERLALLRADYYGA
jgi:hypothetical protein